MHTAFKLHAAGLAIAAQHAPVRTGPHGLCVVRAQDGARSRGLPGGLRRWLAGVRMALPAAGDAALAVEVRQLRGVLDQARQAGVSNAAIRAALAASPLGAGGWRQVAAVCQAGAGWDEDLLYVMREDAIREFELLVAGLPAMARAPFLPALEMLAALDWEGGEVDLGHLIALRAAIAPAYAVGADIGVENAMVAFDNMLSLMHVVCTVRGDGGRADDHEQLSRMAQKNYSAVRRALADACKRESAIQSAQRTEYSRVSDEVVRQIYLRSGRLAAACRAHVAQQLIEQGGSSCI